MVVNSVRPTQLAAHMISKSGDTLSGYSLAWRRVGGDERDLSSDGVVDCALRATLEAEVSAGSMSRRFTVLCRPIQQLFFSPGTALPLKGPPVPYVLSALGTDGQPVLQIAGTVSTEDTSVVDMRDGTLIAKDVGVARVRVTAGDCNGIAPVIVEEPVSTADSLARHRPYEEELAVVPGEFRTWNPPPGLVYITLQGDSSSVDALQLAAAHANCAKLRHVQRGISCMVNDSSLVLVRHMGRRAAQNVRLRMEAMRHPDSAAPFYGTPYRRGRHYCSLMLASNAP
ncbi:MAG: hypothetical protein IBJ03_04400 [Gemmatimonadaceae bacterium]|nr:hypothetical protein [Gemmatimonadaceae bacterium]